MSNKIDKDFEAAAARALAEDKAVVPAIIKPSPKTTVKTTKNIWPLQKDAVAFYGDPYQPDFMANLTHVICPWNFTTGNNIIISHVKCADSLARVLNKTWVDIDKSQDHAHNLGYDVFDGSYVVRPMRGGKLPSMH